MKTKLFIASIFIASLFSACTKEGPAGPAGTNGNANVKSTTQIVTWTKVNTYYNTSIAFADITQEIIDKGSVQVFMIGDNGLQVALPITFTYSGYFTTIDFDVEKGYVHLNFTNSNQSLPTVPTSSTFKVVAIAAN